MSFSLIAHDDPCTPISPCKNCRALAYLRLHLGPKLDEFLRICGIFSEPAVVAAKGTVKNDDLVGSLGPWGVRIDAALQNDGIVTVGDLLSRSREDLLRIPNIGNVSVFNIMKGLERFGLALRTEGENTS